MENGKTSLDSSIVNDGPRNETVEILQYVECRKSGNRTARSGYYSIPKHEVESTAERMDNMAISSIVITAADSIDSNSVYRWWLSSLYSQMNAVGGRNYFDARADRFIAADSRSSELRSWPAQKRWKILRSISAELQLKWLHPKVSMLWCPWVSIWKSRYGRDQTSIISWRTMVWSRISTAVCLPLDGWILRSLLALMDGRKTLCISHALKPASKTCRHDHSWADIEYADEVIFARDRKSMNYSLSKGLSACGIIAKKSRNN